MFLFSMRGSPAFQIGIMIWGMWMVSFGAVLFDAPVALVVFSALLTLIASLTGTFWMLRHRDNIVFVNEFSKRHAFPPRDLWGGVFRLQSAMAALYLFLFGALFMLRFRAHDPYDFIFCVVALGMAAMFSGGPHALIHLLILRFSSSPWRE